MKPEDLSKLANTISRSLDGEIQRQVQQAVGEIPFLVRRYLEDEVHAELRQLVKKAVEKNITIQVTLTKETK